MVSSDNPSKKPKPVAGRILMLMYILIGIGLLTLELVSRRIESSIPLTERADTYQPYPEDVSWVEGNGAIELPPSARDIYARSEGFRELITWIRFTMAPDELELLLASSVCNGQPVHTSEERQSLPIDPEWWTAGESRLTSQCSGEVDTVHQTIWIEETGSDDLEIYVLTAIH